MNHRVLKREKVSTNQNTWKDTWYVMDATGNVMGIYSNEYSTIATNTYEQTFELKELDMYGGERLGLRDQEIILFKEDFTCSSFNGDGTFNSPTIMTTYDLAESSYKKSTRTLQDKKYELSNHLGNVVAVITAYKIPVPVSSPTDLTVTYYKPDVVSYSDYYGFGMMMPGRNGNSGDYRYAFQGQEKDDEIKGTGNTYTAQYWEYDPRLGRRWNIDPVVKEDQSSYQCFNNNPILISDKNGDDGVTASAVFSTTQEVSASLASTGIGAPAALVVEILGDVWALYELLSDIEVPVHAPPTKAKSVRATLNKAIKDLALPPITMPIKKGKAEEHEEEYDEAEEDAKLNKHNEALQGKGKTGTKTQENTKIQGESDVERATNQREEIEKSPFWRKTK